MIYIPLPLSFPPDSAPLSLSLSLSLGSSVYSPLLSLSSPLLFTHISLSNPNHPFPSSSVEIAPLHPLLSYFFLAFPR